MNRMIYRRLEAFERRLARVAAVLGAWALDSERERERRETNAALAAMLRGALVDAGLDPNEAASLRRLEAPEPPRPPAMHPLRRLAERRRPRPLIALLRDLTRRYPRPPAPDLRNASVMQLIGYYCFGPGNQAHAAREAPA
ncbi:MAG TPA: hypothetical protein VFC56_09385 [Stellaceae bacterium]|nr:hypothetical protein [Stellaceae bacterium]